MLSNGELYRNNVNDAGDVRRAHIDLELKISANHPSKDETKNVSLQLIIVFNYHCIAHKDIDPYVATGIVSMGVVEGAKTSPVPLKTGNPSTKHDNNAKDDQAAKLIRTIAESSISGSGTRLVFGERNAAVQEALDHDGKFVLVHPEIESKLKEGNVDPYVIYVTTLIIEMQSKIPQIDFAGGDVDALSREWGGKPEEQVPVHVRQMLWLKENAENFGYQQSGNSWKLKQ